METEKEYRQSVESGRERRFDSKTGEQIFESHYIDGKKEGEEWEIFEDHRCGGQRPAGAGGGVKKMWLSKAAGVIIGAAAGR